MTPFKFLKSEAGAVTVDWVVLTGGITGLGIAVMVVVSGGIENLSVDIGTALSDYEIETEFTTFIAQLLGSNDFGGGAIGDWVGGVAADAGGALGELLMIPPGGLAEMTLAVPDGASQAVFSFDLIGGDSLDSETATVMINGQAVTIATGNHGEISFADSGVPGMTVTTTVQSHGTQMGSSMTEGWNDSVTTVSITMDNPGNSVTLGVASGADQPISDEYFGIDNVSVNAI
jgi:hypothetical protein